MNWPDDKLTRFEVARLIGARSLQIALGAPVLLKEKTDKEGSTKIAKREFSKKLIPITIKRELPNGTNVVVNIKKAIDRWFVETNGEI